MDKIINIFLLDHETCDLILSNVLVFGYGVIFACTALAIYLILSGIMFEILGNIIPKIKALFFKKCKNNHQSHNRDKSSN